MKVVVGRACWRYVLQPRAKGAKPREGALLRFTLRDGSVGYADCHPWRELADDPLDVQLTRWRRGVLCPLLDQSMLLAFFDARARQEKRSLFAGLRIPPSHLSLPHFGWMSNEALRHELESAVAKGFRRVKVKAGREQIEDGEFLGRLAEGCRATGMKVRIDFNARLRPLEVDALLERLEAECDGLDWVDWIEDPCWYDPPVWSRLRHRYKVRLAFDNAREALLVRPREAEVLVYKSAKGPPIPYIELVRELNVPVCYTSYLDHPVGQAFAAYAAADNIVEAASIETCGLLTHDVYEPNAFSERLKTIGPVLIPPEGTGIGFDDLLENLPWAELK